MTTKEMMILRLEGLSLKQIGEMCGISKQAVHKRLDRFYREEMNGRIRCRFDIDEIVFRGIHEYFESTPKLTLEQFYRRLGINCTKETLRRFIVGESNSKLTIPQINKICEVIGKRYEDAFAVRKA